MQKTAWAVAVLLLVLGGLLILFAWFDKQGVGLGLIPAAVSLPKSSPVVGERVRPELSPAPEPCLGNRLPEAVLQVTNEDGVFWNQPVIFSGAASVDDGEILEYQWSFGDGASGAGQTVTHTYAHPGLFLVSLRVKDNCGQWSPKVELVLTVGFTCAYPHNPPQALGGPDLDGVVTESMSFLGQGIADPPAFNQIVEYAWNFGDASSGDNFTGWQTAPVASHSFNHVGNYTARLWVKDSCGATAQDNQIGVHIVTGTGGHPPIANAGPDQVNHDNDADNLVGVALQGDQSFDPDGSTLTYRWFDAGGYPVTGGYVPNPAITLPLGTYPFRLKVEDTEGLVSEDWVLINNLGPADNQPPVIYAPRAEPNHLHLLGELSFNLLAQIGDDGLPLPSGLTATWEQYAGPGQATIMTPEQSLNEDWENLWPVESEVVVPPILGWYRFRLTVTDGEISVSQEVDVEVRPQNERPIANAGPDLLTQVGEEVVFDGRQSTDPDPDGYIASYFWHFGDGSSLVSSSPVVSHIYLSPGVKHAVLSVFDDHALSSASGDVVEVNVSP